MSGSESLPRLNDVPVWRRVLSSPVSDLVRGRVGVTTSVSSLIAAATLPQSLGQLVSQTVQATRLWHRERLDVARELISHFQDGLEAGIASDDLARRFGDPQQAAPLIRRARIRCRSLAWHIWRWTCRSVAALAVALLVVHSALTIRYFMGKPVVSRDYLAEWNAEFRKIPESDRAWPFYRKAWLAYQNPADARQAERWNDTFAELSADDPAWPQLVEFVQNNQESIEQVRRGAARPRLGFRYNDPEDEEFVKRSTGRTSLTLDSEPLISVLIPQIQELRRLTQLLFADLRVALQQDNADAVRQDLKALFGVSQQPSEPKILITELYLNAVFNLGLQAASDVLEKNPELLDERDWIRIAHEIAAYRGGGTIRFDVNTELQGFEDFLQRTFTDDGHGEGRLTRGGTQLLIDVSDDGSSILHAMTRGSQFRAASTLLIGPAAMTLVAGRREQLETAKRFIVDSQAETRGPLFTWDATLIDSQRRSLMTDPVSRMRYAPALAFLPATESAAAAGERITQQRDAVLAAIAVELFRRTTGEWPETLEAVVPRYLPAIPIDRFTGRRLTYKLRDAKPLIYAWGMDGQDDGGRPSTENRGRNFHTDVMSKPARPRKPGEGYDWVFFPRPRFPPEPIDQRRAQP